MPDNGLISGIRSASAGRQAAIAAGLVVVVAGVIALVWFTLLRTPLEPLFTNMRANDAATIVAELDRQKVPYQLAEGGTTILVPADKVDATRLSVMNEDLPLKGTVGFELFNKSDMGLTDFAQKINYQRALQGELARTIMTLDNVETARVHLSLGEDRIFRDDQVPPKASVTLHMKNGGVVSENTALGIQRLVSAAVQKLEALNVAVLDEAGQVVSGNAPETGSGLPASPLVQQRKAIEQYYEGRVRSALEQSYPGQTTGVAVRVGSAEIGTPDQDRNGLSGWNPADRRFPLQVVIEAAWAHGEDAKAGLQTAVASEIDFDQALGDAITFGMIPNAQAAPSPVRAVDIRPGPIASESPDLPLKDGGWLAASILAAFGLVAILLVLVLARRRRLPVTLGASGRAAFANRLKEALDREEGRALHGN